MESSYQGVSYFVVFISDTAAMLVLIFLNPHLFASCTDTVKLLEA
jgi:hypothetical protein